MMVADVLEENSYRVMEADSADEALKARKDIRLLFTGIEMRPGPNGLELARLGKGRA
jgi:hypothetical protein